MSEAKRGGSRIAVVLRTLFYALTIAFIVGLVIGTLLRRQLERPVRYMGLRDGVPSESLVKSRPTSWDFAVLAVNSIRTTDPGHVGHVLPRVLVPRNDE